MNTQTVTINLVPGLSTPPVVNVKQGDIGRPIAFRVMDGTGLMTAIAGATAKIEGTKPSGLGFSVTGTISGNMVTLDTTEAMTQEAGRIPAEISFTKTGLVLGTANFILAVERDPHPENVIDGTYETMDDIQTQVNALDTRVTALEAGGGGSGLTDDVKTALLNAFAHVAWVDANGQDYYDALESALDSGDLSVSLMLSQVSSSNTATTVGYGESYNTTLTASTGYTLNTVTVTMGGVDITSTSYSSGTVSIPSVTGNIVITATAVPSTTDTTAQIATEGYVSEHTGTGTSASNYRLTAKTYGGITIKYQLDEATTSLQLAGIIPFADSTITKGVGCLIIYDSTDTIVNHLDEQSNTSPNRWAQLATGTLTEFVSTLYTVGTYSQITFSVDTRYLADAYMYDYVTGQVFFAGENTPYYGKHNISEVTT